MSKVTKWQYNDIFEPRREKLINMLLCEIIFLKSQLKQSKSKNQEYYLNIALNKLEFVLKILKKSEKDISDMEFDRIIKVVYEVFKEIVINIE
ncbi:MAG: hypothetical protein ACFFHD_15555 [Promethearchaeota archaeon]